ncbi:MAG: 4Fe-4S dicluster domain-containing protein [Candidatus Zixiibacteriota bacterium]
MKKTTPVFVTREDFQQLFEVLGQKGYQITGPTLRDHAIIYDYISSVEDLPAGWRDRQDNGTYRLEKSDRPTLFDFTVGPNTWKKILYPPELKLLDIKRDGKGFEVQGAQPHIPKRALIGVRACELRALAIHDKILSEGAYIDIGYLKSREKSFIVAVNCTRPGGTCFCASMHTGPEAESGYDLVLTEICEPNRHYFVMESGSKKGEEILAGIAHRPATDDEIHTAVQALEKAAGQMGRKLEADDIVELLYRRFDDPHWQEISERCLSCGNCTMVCPTCFCMNIEDTTSLDGREAARYRKWDSCFTVEFSYIHGGSIRATAVSRYRQWMMHKLAYWQDQFGMPGCVGCGRCITWCPVGIDITEEARVFRERDK